MSTPLLRAVSLATGWCADRRLPRWVRSPLYRTYARAYRVDLTEVRLALADHPSFTAFFVRRLRDGARVFPTDPATLPAPCDGTFQSFGAIENGTILQAKGRPYPVEELLALAPGEVDLAGGHAWTVYLSPRDYHRVHAPVVGSLEEVRWCDGARYSVAPSVLAKRPKVLSINERAVLRFATAHGPLWLVMVGALNVGRIRVVGVEPGTPGAPRRFERGEELARFEMGSTVVLVAPRGGPRPLPTLALGRPVRMGEPIGRTE